MSFFEPGMWGMVVLIASAQVFGLVSLATGVMCLLLWRRAKKRGEPVRPSAWLPWFMASLTLMLVCLGGTLVLMQLPKALRTSLDAAFPWLFVPVVLTWFGLVWALRKWVHSSR